MKKSILILAMVLIAAVGFGQTKYELNYDSVGIGKPNTTQGVRLNGKVWMKNLTNGTSLDSQLVIKNGRVFKVLSKEYVPYTGATADVDLGVNSISATNFFLAGTIEGDFDKGFINKGGLPFIHNFFAGPNPASGVGGGNINVGVNSGNFNPDNVSYASTMVGEQTGMANTTGYSNVGLGHFVLRANTTGFGNTGVGTNAMPFATTGNENSALGWHALIELLTGSGNTAIGVDALNLNTAGNRNTALGKGAGASSTGSDNVFLGYFAGLSETTASDQLHIANNKRSIIRGDFNLDKVNIPTGSFSVGNYGDATFNVRARANNSNGGIKMYGFTYPTDVTYWSENQLAMQYNSIFHTVFTANGDSYFGLGGNVGVGKDTGIGAKLDVNGSARASANDGNANTLVRNTDLNNYVTTNTTQTINSVKTFTNTTTFSGALLSSSMGFQDSGFINLLQSSTLASNVNTYLPSTGGQIPNTLFTGTKQVKTASGNGSATTISIAHGMTGITSASWCSAIANNSASAGIQYVTVDASNINIFYTVAPVSGTNNLLYSIEIKP